MHIGVFQRHTEYICVVCVECDSNTSSRILEVKLLFGVQVTLDLVMMYDLGNIWHAFQYHNDDILGIKYLIW